MIPKHIKTTLAALGCLLLVPRASFGQFDTGQIAGFVYDVSGSVVAGTAVTAINDGNGEERRSTTNESGHYVFPNLVVGTYTITAEANGFKTFVQNGLHPSAVRLDSGDLLEVSKRVRLKLDQAGLSKTRIFASGDLDEFIIADLLAHAAPIDAFGVGTALATSKDAPALGGVYELVDIESGGEVSYRAKFSEEKATYPGLKQVFRFSDSNGIYREDLIARNVEKYPEAVPLLEPVMRGGRRTVSSSSIQDIRSRAREEIARLPEASRSLRQPELYRVRFSKGLEELLARVREQTLRLAR